MTDNCMAYGERLFALQPTVIPLQDPVFSDSDYQAWQAITSLPDAEQEIQRIALLSTISLQNLPVFDDYRDDWHWVRAAEKTKRFDVVFCERGTLSTHYANCTFPELVFAITDIALPSYSHAAQELASRLHSIDDQRILLWLNFSSKLRQMYEIHPRIGQQYAGECIGWMEDELGRMEIDVTDTKLLHGLMLTGVLRDEAFRMLADSHK